MKYDIEKACDTLKEGGVILYPTDTIWGLGCDSTNPAAVEKVYAIKKRAETKSMLILVDSLATLKKYTLDVPSRALELIKTSEKPLTIIYPKAISLAENLISDDGSVGIRITNEIFSKKLCEKFGKPIVSTSANISGMASPRCFNEITEEIKDAVDFIVSYRQSDMQGTMASKIMKIDDDGKVLVIRE